MSTQKEIARLLLQSNAIKFNPSSPFTWASGWKSPIYTDNRKTLSFPKVRTSIRDSFIQTILNRFGKPDYIAGVATGAIAQAALVAEAMELPMVYVRSSAKAHGMENLIEGVLEKGKSVVVIEDLVSTGGSSLKAVEALRAAGMKVPGMVAIFSYGFSVAEQNFANHHCQLETLSDYTHLLELLVQEGVILESDLDILQQWRKQPETWGK